ncbi:cysteine--tRNA ligase [Cucumibacter marinus]|uniref:cysteine--tRNA ligase n=1 Tax=Cucumibacter marinus TaxID=1121252 RepID=UPI0004288A29|nr:cysteine--tRNA ligase [Cucumibacter marinus]
MTDIRLYNTLTRSKERFTPLDPANVRMYVCGPTVYDFAHIGNARPAIVFDVLFRLLTEVYGGDHVTYVRNVTDVDDKINARAAERGVDIRTITEETLAQYRADMGALGCLQPTVEPRATEHIGEMVAMIDKLIADGHAYVADDHVLFETASMADYGKLSNRALDEMIAGARVEVASYKKAPTDFVLWKPSRDGEPGWPSPGGITVEGRPGWHIECSAMSERYLGETFDIHGGGIDLIFPHHENEIAQSRCAHGGAPMAQVWMHNGFLQIEGEKMSKSLGNFFTVRELLDTDHFGGRKWPGEVLRLAMLMSHYREPIDFAVAKLEEAVSILDRWERAAKSAGASTGAVDQTFLDALADDLSTPLAIARVHELMNNPDTVPAALASLELIGIDPVREAAVDANVEARIEARLACLMNKDFETADKIRDDLAGEGIVLMDYKDPETGARRTKWEMKR